MTSGREGRCLSSFHIRVERGSRFLHGGEPTELVGRLSSTGEDGAGGREEDAEGRVTVAVAPPLPKL